MKHFYPFAIIAVLFLSTYSVADAQEYRSLDGSQNNLDHPFWGAVDAHMRTPGTVGYADGISAPAGPNRPNPRQISNLMFGQSTMENDPRGVSAYAWVWGQFIDHDITLVPDHATEQMPISIPPYDFFFDPNGLGTVKIPMNRSVYDTNTGTSTANPRVHPNKITAFIDASNVYGSDDNRASYLRLYSKGKLRVSDGNLPPYNSITGEYSAPRDNNAPEMAMPFPTVYKFFVAGDVRANENPFLLSMHTLFIREHNRLCQQYFTEHPQWSDEKIYQEARRHVGAIIQAITYNEWLPTLGLNLPQYTGYQESVDPGIMNVFSAAAFRYGHTTINNTLLRMDNNGNHIPQGDIMLRDAFFNPDVVADAGGIEPYLIGMSTVVQQNFDCKVIDDLRNFLFGPPGAGGMDLVAINIQRGRDRGLPDYNTVRSDFGLAPLTNFSEMTNDPLMNMTMQMVYGGNINNIDPWVGMLAEDHDPNALFGHTAMTIISKQFKSIRDGDRFYFENDPAFSPDEKAEIKNTRLADIIRRNAPVTCISDNVFMAQHLTTATKDLASNESSIRLYPNPVSDQMTIEVIGEASTDARVQIFDPLGSLQIQEQVTLEQGANRIQVQIPNDLPSGVYRVVVSTNNFFQHASFIKN